MHGDGIQRGTRRHPLLEVARHLQHRRHSSRRHHGRLAQEGQARARQGVRSQVRSARAFHLGVGRRSGHPQELLASTQEKVVECEQGRGCVDRESASRSQFQLQISHQRLIYILNIL